MLSIASNSKSLILRYHLDLTGHALGPNRAETVSNRTIVAIVRSTPDGSFVRASMGIDDSR